MQKRHTLPCTRVDIIKDRTSSQPGISNIEEVSGQEG